MDSRSIEDGDGIRRRRECEACSKRFTTFVRAERALVSVLKRDGRREPFDRAKVLTGLVQPVRGGRCIETLERVAEEIERTVVDAGEPTVPSREIGDRVMERLRNLDDVAYVRFVSVYRRMGDVDRLVEEIEALKARKQHEAELASQILLIPLAPHRTDRN